MAPWKHRHHIACVLLVLHALINQLLHVNEPLAFGLITQRFEDALFPQGLEEEIFRLELCLVFFIHPRLDFLQIEG